MRAGNRSPKKSGFSYRRRSPRSPASRHKNHNPSSHFRNSGRCRFDQCCFKKYGSEESNQKAGILLEAGRLAAEYLVSKGFLSASLLPVKLDSDRNEEVKEKDGVHSTHGDQINNARREVGFRRRRYNVGINVGDEKGVRRNWRSRSRECLPGLDWNREKERKRRRSRDERYSVERDNNRFRHNKFDEYGSRARRAPDELRHSRSEVTHESESEEENCRSCDSTRWKRSYFSIRGDSSHRLRDSEGRYKRDDQQESVSGENMLKRERASDIDLVKLISRVKVPKKRRSSFAQRSSEVHQSAVNDAERTLPDDPEEVSEVVINEDATGVALIDRNMYQSDISRCEASNVSIVQSVQPVEDSADPNCKLSGNLQGIGIYGPTIDVQEGACPMEIVTKSNNTIRPNDFLTPKVSQENDYPQFDTLWESQSWLHLNKFSGDEEAIETTDPNNSGDSLFPIVGTESPIDIKEEKQHPAISFRLFDLNLMETPEMTEIPDASVTDQVYSSTLSLDSEKELLANLAILTPQDANRSTVEHQESGSEQMISMISMGDDLGEANICNILDLKSEAICSGLDNISGPTEHSGIRDNFSLKLSDFLPVDFSAYQPVKANLDNLKTGANLVNAQVLSASGINHGKSMENF
ncbi:uncharacterized protein [Typha latifolia]|uniref:uncharacterized protein n=1 Tax=Typha latifolia TaxID=4733 RepID=UPI003C2D73A9